jgi:hypothetical protein
MRNQKDMANLNSIEKLKLEKFLGMSRGKLMKLS